MVEIMNNSEFLIFVEKYVSKNPEVGAYVSDYVAKGINISRLESIERAADMEVALLFCIDKKLKNKNLVILEKLLKWQGKTSLIWNETILKLKKELK